MGLSLKLDFFFCFRTILVVDFVQKVSGIEIGPAVPIGAAGEIFENFDLFLSKLCPKKTKFLYKKNLFLKYSILSSVNFSRNNRELVP
jgi:hypothetical protein